MKYLDYLVSKVGEDRAKSLFETSFHTLDGVLLYGKLNSAAKTLSPEYDIGVVIAGKGLILGYQFHQNGFPLRVVDQKRIGKGATWNPIDKLKEEEFKDKRVLLIENDIVTGRTTRRAVRELSEYQPKFIDLLLAFEKIPVHAKDYQHLHKLGIVPDIRELFPKLDIKDIRFTKKGIEINYLDLRKKPCFIDNNTFITVLNTRDRVPKVIRKTFTLEKHF
ncbi:MAG: phosphoribosyltransferase [Nanoarchaeota archaeon]